MTDNIKLFVSREEQGYLIRWGKKKKQDLSMVIFYV